MKVTISCAARFHSYNLAAQLNKKNILNRLITTYPVFEVHKYGIPKNKIKSLLFWEILHRSISKISGYTNMNLSALDPSINEIYDRASALFVPADTDTFIGWSSRSERSIINAKKAGMNTILERGSSHIEFQTELLKEEYTEYSNQKNLIYTHPEVIEKELREYELADFISVPSEFAKRSFISKGVSASKIVVNNLGIHLENFKPGKKNDDVFRILYVGHMSLRKGVHYLLKAVVELKLKNIELVLIGSKLPEMDPYFKAYRDYFTYLESKPQSELNYYYTQASVFVICSIEEGMAMVQLQAMSSGIPVICTTNTGGQDIIRDGIEGFVLPIRDVESIKDKIQWMYHHQEEAKAMGGMARQRVSNGYSWEDYGDRYYQFIKSIQTKTPMYQNQA